MQLLLNGTVSQSTGQADENRDVRFDFMAWAEADTDDPRFV